MVTGNIDLLNIYRLVKHRSRIDWGQAAKRPSEDHCTIQFVGGKKRTNWRSLSPSGARKKKEEFPGPMDDTRPGNSFPQICVVSVNDSVGNEVSIQEHGRIVPLGNLAFYYFVNS
jgi:hypothetical protein